jgi:hypothetical protein
MSDAEQSPRAAIILTLDDDGDVHLVVEFDPMTTTKPGGNPVTHAAAMIGAQRIVEWLRGEGDLTIPGELA